MIYPDGTIHWLRSEGRFVAGDDGAAGRMLGITIDITEQMTIEAALYRKEEEFALAFEAARIGWWHWSEKTDQMVLSEGAKAVLGVLREGMLTLTEYMQTIHPDDRDSVEQTWRRSIEKGAYFLVEFRVFLVDGSIRWVEGRGHSYKDALDQGNQMIGVCMDISERKQVEASLHTLGSRLIEAQEGERVRIAGELHDDVCQRLAMLEMELESLQDSVLEQEIRAEVERLAFFARDIAKDIQALSHELHTSKLEILGLPAAMKGFCAEFARKHRVRIKFTSTGVPTQFPWDISVGLYRVLQEALHNAKKHSDSHRIIVELRGDRSSAELMVRDFGRGFDPRAALNAPGLGLLSMRERVKFLRGTISIESEPNWGTEIRVRVPVEEKAIAA